MSEEKAVANQSSTGWRVLPLLAFLLLPLVLMATSSGSCVVAGGGGRCRVLALLSGLAYPAWLVYALPTGVAVFRGVAEWRTIAAINVLGGWTLVGWVLALRRAMNPASAAPSPSTAKSPPQATEWTPSSWEPPPAGYPLPPSREAPGLVLRDAGAEAPPEPPAAEDAAAPKRERLGFWAGIAGAPAWVREGDWPVSALLVKLCGGLEVYCEGERLTDDLVSRPAVRFMWVSLLVRWLLEPSQVPSRDGFAEEMAPGLDRDSRLGRLRNLLADRKALHPSLAEAIRADRNTVTFDVAAAAANGRFATDTQLLHELADRGRRDTHYEVAEITAVEKLVEACSSELLPEFQNLDERITGEKGMGAELITALRSRHSDDLATVRVALAQTHLETGSAAQAVELLRLALDAKPDREDVARRLVAALIAAGRSSEAESVREEYLS